jgi:hypothetical protein
VLLQKGNHPSIVQWSLFQDGCVLSRDDNSDGDDTAEVDAMREILRIVREAGDHRPIDTCANCGKGDSGAVSASPAKTATAFLMSQTDLHSTAAHATAGSCAWVRAAMANGSVVAPWFGNAVLCESVPDPAACARAAMARRQSVATTTQGFTAAVVSAIHCFSSARLATAPQPLAGMAYGASLQDADNNGEGLLTAEGKLKVNVTAVRAANQQAAAAILAAIASRPATTTHQPDAADAADAADAPASSSGAAADSDAVTVVRGGVRSAPSAAGLPGSAARSASHEAVARRISHQHDRHLHRGILHATNAGAAGGPPPRPAAAPPPVEWQEEVDVRAFGAKGDCMYPEVESNWTLAASACAHDDTAAFIAGNYCMYAHTHANTHARSPPCENTP